MPSFSSQVLPDISESMGYSKDDFGYDFIDNSVAVPVEAGNASDAESDIERAGGDSENVDELVKKALLKEEEESLMSKDVSQQKGKLQEDDETSLMQKTAVGCCACCCFLMVIFIVVGTLLYTYDNYKDDPPYVIAGTVLIGLGIISCCCGMICCCVFPLAQISPKKDSAGEIKWDIKRENGKYTEEKKTLESLRLDLVANVKGMKAAKEKEKKKTKELKKRKKEMLEQKVVSELEAGLSTAHIKRRNRPCAFKIVFDGDIMVSTIELLREQISLALKLGTPGLDQVVIVITSPGGAVTMYGLAASQLIRIKKAGLKLIVCVDSVAASGGYLMGVVADKILAAPFALVGSIGVISIVPNVHDLLEKNDIHTHVFTAGKYKAPVSVIGEITDEGKEKFLEELEEIHHAFKDHIVLNRPAMKDTIDEVATGEAYLAVQAKQKGLVDEIMTSDEYFESIAVEFDIISLQEKKKKSFFPFEHFAKLSSVQQKVEEKMTTTMNRKPMFL